MQRGLLILAVLGGGSLVALVLFFLWASSGQYGSERYAELVSLDEFPVTESQEEITVVSYNIGYLSGLTNNQAITRTQQLYDDNLATAIAALQEVQPDILALQEVDIDSQRSFEINQVEAIGQTLSYPQQAIAINWDKRYVPFPFWPPAAHFGSIVSGQAVLSRFPITAHERRVLEKVASNPFYYNALYLDRLAQVAELTVGERTLIVINIHLEAFDNATRSNQTTFVRQLAETYAQDHPVLLLGDFNSALNRPAEGTPTIAQMVESASFSSAVPVEDFTKMEQFTFPADIPAYKLDYIFYTPETLELLDVEVLTNAEQASDHLPLMAQFRLR
ncbi:MAG: endonuclease/exonuclease/phosphatase family protein [Cyanobacteria bacterium P01_H01_bin.58]